MSWFVITGITVKQLSLVKCIRGSRTFCQGGGVPGQSDKKSSDVFFVLFLFLVLSLFYRSQMVNFKEIYHFSRFRGGPTFSRGIQLFPGGSNCLFPIETHITFNFPGGGVWAPCPPPPPSGSALEMLASGSVVLVCKCS